MVESTREGSIETNESDDHDHDQEKRFEPLQPPQTREQDHDANAGSRTSSARSARSSLERTCSITDGYSHHAVDHDTLQEPSDEEKALPKPGEEFVVKWDGPSDPANPRNMHVARKWVIVVVLSLGSICVYVEGPGSTP